jgi:hypothetical protein
MVVILQGKGKLGACSRFMEEVKRRLKKKQPYYDLGMTYPKRSPVIMLAKHKIETDILAGLALKMAVFFALVAHTGFATGYPKGLFYV